MHYFRYIVFAIVSIFLIVFTYSIHYIEPISETYTASPSQIELLSQDEKDSRFMTALGLMQGHLIVGKELLDQGTPDQAEPHLGHPVNELYGEIAAQQAERQAPDFKDTLVQLYEASQYEPASTRSAESYALSMQQIQESIETLPVDVRQSPKFILKSINEMLEVADIEYAAGIANGEVVEPIEYQDSMGFVIIAEQLYATISDLISQNNPDADASIKASLIKLKEAWPSVNKPSPIVLTPDNVSQLILAIQTSSESLYGVANQ